MQSESAPLGRASLTLRALIVSLVSRSQTRITLSSDPLMQVPSAMTQRQVTREACP